MKNFSQWEAREERRLHKDLQRHRKGVLFLGDPPPDPVLPNADEGVLHVPDPAVAAQEKEARLRMRRSASQHTPFADVKGKRRAGESLPRVPEGTPSAGPSRLAGSGAGGEGKDVLAGVDVAKAPGLALPGRVPSAPAELPSGVRCHSAPHHPPETPGAMLCLYQYLFADSMGCEDEQNNTVVGKGARAPTTCLYVARH